MPDIPSDGLTDDEIRAILRMKSIAVVGMSRDPNKAAHVVPRYMMRRGYEVLPVNPFAQEILGLKSFASLEELPKPPEIVNIFRPSDQVPPFVEAAIRVGAKVVWMQEGIYNREAAALAKEHGLKVAWNRCIFTEHRRLRTSLSDHAGEPL